MWIQPLPHVMATFLDPHFKQLKHLEEEPCRNVQAAVVNTMKQQATTERPGEIQPVHNTSAKKPKLDSMIWDLISVDIGAPESSSATPAADTREEELHHYAAAESVTTQQYQPAGLLNTEGEHNHMSLDLAKKLLCMPATSASLECVFSASDLVASQQQAALSP